MFDKSIIVCGDLHGVWGPINSLINKKNPKIVLQCGDFGFWPQFHNTSVLSTEYKSGTRRYKKWDQYGLKPDNSRIYFCPGNHEDWEALNLLATSDNPTHVEIAPDVFFMPRCSTLRLPDGRNILFMGGADSTDKAWRRNRYDWFSEEIITQKDIYNLPNTDIDIVISHATPQDFKTDLYLDSQDYRQFDSYWLEKFKDPSCQALSSVLNKYKPKLWFFAHYHVSKTSTFRGTRWFALNMSCETGWWTYMRTRGVL